MAYVIRSIPQCDDCGHEWLPRSYPKRCPNRACRSLNWNRTATPLKPKLEASLAVTPPVQELAQVEKMKIALAAMESVGKPEAIQAAPLVEEFCGVRSEYDQQTGEYYTCGKAPHSGKIQHGNWQREA